MPLNRNTTQHQIDLIIIIAVPSQILNDSQTTLSVRNSGIHIVLFALFVDAEAFEVDHAAGGELRLHGAGDIQGGFAAYHAEFGLAVFEDGEFDGDDAGDFDGAAEGDFAVALCQGN